jgi:hypothetical protein
MIVARAGALVALVLVAGPPSPATATRAFGHWLQKRYAAPEGYWTCPAGQSFGDRISCSAEVRVGRRRHFVGATARLSGGRVVISRARDQAWVRRWSSFSRRPLAGFDTPGTASVNSPVFDWAFLGLGAHDGWRRGRTSFKVNSYDGDSTGLRRFFVFRCVVRGALVTCTNAFGDAMRYRPRA